MSKSEVSDYETDSDSVSSASSATEPEPEEVQELRKIANPPKQKRKPHTKTVSEARLENLKKARAARSRKIQERKDAQAKLKVLEDEKKQRKERRRNRRKNQGEVVKKYSGNPKKVVALDEEEYTKLTRRKSRRKKKMEQEYGSVPSNVSRDAHLLDIWRQLNS